MQSPVQPEEVHSCPLPQRVPSARQMQAPPWQASERSSAVQSTQIDPPVPQVLAEDSRHLPPWQHPSGQVRDVHSSESSPQAANSSAKQTIIATDADFTSRLLCLRFFILIFGRKTVKAQFWYN